MMKEIKTGVRTDLRTDGVEHAQSINDFAR
jgi:hypothetical protein